jgi:DNA-binding transcriptional MerR regulator
MDAKRYTIGELAGATGLTVRTLHHYDRIGLLQPTDRSPSGYRLYGSDDVQRLYRILALRQLGLSLKDIDAALAGDWADLRQAIARHLTEVQRQVALSRSLEHKLRRLLDQADRHQDLTNEQFIDAMETIVSFTHQYSGKVRDIYDAGDGRLLFVASDRMSAFDVVMGEPVADKGRVLTAMTAFWLDQLADLAPNHLVSLDVLAVRRGADAGLVAVLAGRRVGARPHAAVVRQAAAARSPRDARLGQDAAAPGAAARGHRLVPRALRGRVRAHHRHALRRLARRIGRGVSICAVS